MKNGSMDNSTSNSNIKDYIKSKFITISKYIKTKLDISGGHITGDINMNNNSIINVKEPQSDNEVITKGYVTQFYGDLSKDLIITNENKIITTATLLQQDINKKLNIDGDVLNGDLDMNWHNLSNTRFPIDSLDAVNQLYVQVLTQNDDVDCDKLIQIANILKFVCDSSQENIVIEKYKPQLYLCLNYATIILSLYSSSFNDINKITNNCIFFTNLKVQVLNMIQCLPEAFLIEFKVKLIERDLIQTPENGSIGKHYRRFINKTSKLVDPRRSNNELELLVQKNLLLLDLGFVYFIEELLKLFCTLSTN